MNGQEQSNHIEGVTSRASYSFYVTAHNEVRIRQAAQFGDALTVAGPKGPETLRKLRASGFDKPVLFDGIGYAGSGLLPEEWVRLQRTAGTDRALLPGVYVPWTRDDVTALAQVTAEQALFASDLGAALVLAIDGRWIARRHSAVIEALGSTSQPVALVLADPRDPLAIVGAVSGLRSLAQQIPHLSLLRCDHGGLGLLAAGGDHAAIGLTSTNRHFVATGMSARRVIDNTARLFLPRLLDWFRAAEVAGWSAAGVDTICTLPCCHGEQLARYLDEDLDAGWHNMHALAHVGEYILNADPDDRLVEYLTLCQAAISRYGLAGFHGPEKPKAQLNSWVFS